MQSRIRFFIFKRKLVRDIKRSVLALASLPQDMPEAYELALSINEAVDMLGLPEETFIDRFSEVTNES